MQCPGVFAAHAQSETKRRETSRLFSADENPESVKVHSNIFIGLLENFVERVL